MRRVSSSSSISNDSSIHPTQLNFHGDEYEENPLFLDDSRNVKVDPDIEKNLKQYQREGVEFLWRNCFIDFNHKRTSNECDVGGCILAHYMGLGKSLTTIALLHTVLTSSPRSTGKKQKQKQMNCLLHTVLLVAPANTLSNWVDELEKWTCNLQTPELVATNLGEVNPQSRKKKIKQWKRRGGILLLSDSMFLKASTDIFREAQPDILVLDEAHTMLKHSGNKGFKTLLNIQIKRKILLTGTPLQNNVTEYYRMVEYIRPGVIGVESEQEFEEKYRNPIEMGLPSDASKVDKIASMQLQMELKRKLEPYVDRKGPAVLRRLLPPIYDNLLYLQRSRIQDRVLKLEQKARKNNPKRANFFSWYSRIAPILNHPGTLKLARTCHGNRIIWKTQDNVVDEWFMEAGMNHKEFETLQHARTSPKLVILSHIIASALKRDEKILVFSKDLKTLDIIECFLAQADWKSHVASLRILFDKVKLGGWQKNQDYFRIDGSVESSRRGGLVDRFNDEKTIKAFLISSLAGGIGINLCSANIVVITDNHFNPAVSNQCVSRAHRLGQTKPVYCFRLAMENTAETKIYARSVTKDGVAIQVVDGKFSDIPFKAEELKHLQRIENIVSCDECRKDRRLIDQDPPSDNCKWICKMNLDTRYNNCHIPVEQNLQRNLRGPMPILDNPILEYLMGVVNHQTRRTPLVMDYLPVQITHAADLCCEDAINQLKDEVSEGKSSVSEY